MGRTYIFPRRVVYQIVKWAFFLLFLPKTYTLQLYFQEHTRKVEKQVLLYEESFTQNLLLARV